MKQRLLILVLLFSLTCLPSAGEATDHKHKQTEGYVDDVYRWEGSKQKVANTITPAVGDTAKQAVRQTANQVVRHEQSKVRFVQVQDTVVKAVIRRSY